VGTVDGRPAAKRQPRWCRQLTARSEYILMCSRSVLATVKVAGGLQCIARYLGGGVTCGLLHCGPSRSLPQRHLARGMTNTMCVGYSCFNAAAGPCEYLSRITCSNTRLLPPFAGSVACVKARHSRRPHVHHRLSRFGYLAAPRSLFLAHLVVWGSRSVLTSTRTSYPSQVARSRGS
jgi:hypothetical protein